MNSELRVCEGGKGEGERGKGGRGRGKQQNWVGFELQAARIPASKPTGVHLLPVPLRAPAALSNC